MFFFNDSYFFLIEFFFINLLIAVLLMFAPFVANKGVYEQSFELLTTYECGFNPFMGSQMQFDVRFYIVALLFLILDLEVIFLYPIIVVNIAIFDFFELSVLGLFLFILIFGFIYEWSKGALDW